MLDEVADLRRQLPVDIAEQIQETFERLSGGLSHIAQAIELCARITESETIAGRTRSVESLIDGLCASDSSSLDFQLPTRAILGQGFLHAKINFFKALIYVMEPHHDVAEPVVKKLHDLLGETLYFRLAEELLIGCIANAANPPELKRSATHLLIPMWNQRQALPLQDFTALMLSAWRARCRVQEVFGTLVGFHEVTSLLHAECEPRFLDFFSRELGTVDEREALREFLFGLSYENLQTLSKHMQENGVRNVSSEDVVRIIGHGPSTSPRGGGTAEAVYLSYRRRRVRADYRVLTGRPGPHKTAEGYLMEYLLLNKWEPGR